MSVSIKGWKTLAFNAAVLLVASLPESREAIISALGGGHYAVLAYGFINICLRLATVGPVAMMWLGQDTKDGMETRKTE
jgi:hypothetical protein